MEFVVISELFATFITKCAQTAVEFGSINFINEMNAMRIKTFVDHIVGNNIGHKNCI